MFMVKWVSINYLFTRRQNTIIVEDDSSSLNHERIKMAKEITRVAKLEFLAGQAKPGPELAGLGIVMPDFSKQFNDATKNRGSEPVPVTITIYKDKSFDFQTHSAPAAYKLKEAAKIKLGSANSKTTKVATITKKQLKEIAEYKLGDMNTNSVEAAMRSIAGTAKNMGILIEGIDNVEEEKAKAEEAARAQATAEAKEKELEEIARAASESIKEIEVETVKQKSSDEPTESKGEN